MQLDAAALRSQLSEQKVSPRPPVPATPKGCPQVPGDAGLRVPRAAALRHRPVHRREARTWRPHASIFQLLSAEILHHRGLVERLLAVADPLLRSCPEPLRLRLQVSGRAGWDAATTTVATAAAGGGDVRVAPCRR